jgi:hypothetical protein
VVLDGTLEQLVAAHASGGGQRVDGLPDLLEQ